MYFTTRNKEGVLGLTRDFFLRKQRVTVQQRGAMETVSLVLLKGRCGSLKGEVSMILGVSLKFPELFREKASYESIIIRPQVTSSQMA